MTKENPDRFADPIPCSPADGPLVPIDPGRSPAAIVAHFRDWANKEYSHAASQWGRSRRGEICDSGNFYWGRMSGMSMLLAELENVQQEDTARHPDGA